MATVDQQIEDLSRRRQELWATGGGDPGEVEKLSAQLAALYEERRLDRRETKATRDEVVRRARIESELERLIDKP